MSKQESRKSGSLGTADHHHIPLCSKHPYISMELSGKAKAPGPSIYLDDISLEENNNICHSAFFRPNVPRPEGMIHWTAGNMILPSLANYSCPECSHRHSLEDGKIVYISNEGGFYCPKCTQILKRGIDNGCYICENECIVASIDGLETLCNDPKSLNSNVFKIIEPDTTD